MMNKFKEIIKKNFTLLWRSKNTIITIFFGPLILIFLLGLAFNSNELSNISVASYSKEYNDLSNSLLNGLKKENFNVIKTKSEIECINNIKFGKNHLCIIMPSDFGVTKNNELVVYIDQSKVNLVENIINILSENIREKTSKISFDLTNVLLDKLNKVKNLSLKSSDLVIKLINNDKKTNEILKKIILNINELELNINHTISKIGELKIKVEKGVDSKDIIEEISELVDDSIDLVDDMDINSSNLADIEDNLENIKDEFKKSDIFDQYYWEKIDLIIKNLESNIIIIQKIKNKLAEDWILIEKSQTERIEMLGELKINLKNINSNVTHIRVRNVSKIVNPITTDVRPIIPNKSYLNYLFPTLIVLIIMFSSVLLSSTAIVVEKKDKAFFRNLISPTNNLIFLITRFATDFLIVFVQLIIFFIISLLFLKIGIFFNFNTLLILLIIISFFILLGILIGNLFNSEETSILFSIIITSIILFFSNTLLPLENMSKFIYQISKLNPFVLAETALRKSIVYGLNIHFIWKEILLLILWILLIIAIILFISKINLKQFKELIKNMIFVEE